MQLDQNKSVGHPTLFEGKDRLKDDHVRVLVDALSHTCAADSWKKARVNLSCLVPCTHWLSPQRGISWPFRFGSVAALSATSST